METLSRAQARRVALAAQGFLDPPHEPPTLRTLVRTIARTGVLQVDSVNVLARAHLVPLYSRMGPYDPELLRRAAEERPRRLVEYWAHVQALMPVELWPVMQHRMDHYRAREGKWWRGLPGDLVAAVLADVTRHGASTAREVSARLGHDGAARTEHWGWNWSEARRALDLLFTSGDVAIAARTRAFEPRYDLPERVLPRAVLEAPVPERADAERELVRRAARSHGVATLACLRDYYRLPDLARTRTAVAELVEDGALVPVRIEGWDREAWLDAGARRPRRVHARTLLSPFDPVVWERERARRLFGFDYRIEIYVPAQRRVHGYYVLPFLLGERLVARVDLKADRRADGGRGVLVVHAAFAEEDAPPATAAELAAELERLAGWLGLASVAVGKRGDLASPLAREVAARRVGAPAPRG